MAYLSRTSDLAAILVDIESQFHLDDQTLTALVKAFLEEVHQGLSNYNHPMAMIPTFVTGVPDGSETGTFLALDLGGTNLRVCEVELHGDHTFSLRQQKYKVSEALKTGEASVLFDYLADSVDAFLTESGADSPPAGIPASLTSPVQYGTHDAPNSPVIPDIVHLGLTFSFPVEQTALDSGILLTWTKGFAAKNAIGKDIVRLLQDAFDRKHMHVKCVALVNDTVGALLSRAYTGGGCILGAIFGTGTNGAYVEDVANITKLGNGPAAARGGKMVVNTEWGGFNNSRATLPSTPYDNKLDRESINPSFQAFEKFISGMYLGEITRNVLLSLIDASPRPLLFGGKSTAAVNNHYGLDTAVMSAVEEAWEPGVASRGAGEGEDEGTIEINGKSKSISDPEWELSLSPVTRARLGRVRDTVVSHLGFKEGDVSLRDAEVVRRVCAMVARRAARLSGCAVAAIVVQTGNGALGGGEKAVDGRTERGKISVGVDGSLIQFYPNFEWSLRESLRVLVGEEVEKRVDIGMAKDGSGVGAALCALQAAKQSTDLSL